MGLQNSEKIYKSKHIIQTFQQEEFYEKYLPVKLHSPLLIFVVAVDMWNSVTKKQKHSPSYFQWQ